jgi:plasmid stabilization system protein ParE
MHRVVLTNRAETSLQEITDYYLLEFTPERAMKVIDSIVIAFAKIARKPQLFPVNFDIAHPQQNIRQAIVHNTFKIIFRFNDKEIEIIEIFHGSRNPRLLKDIK